MWKEDEKSSATASAAHPDIRYAGAASFIGCTLVDAEPLKRGEEGLEVGFYLKPLGEATRLRLLALEEHNYYMQGCFCANEGSLRVV